MLHLLLRLAFALVASGVPLSIAYVSKQRFGVRYPLLAVGLLSYSGAFLLQTALGAIFSGPLLDSALFGALFLGIVIGFTDVGMRFAAYLLLARDVLYRPQAVMIGVGHALPRIVFTAVLAVAFTISDREQLFGTAAFGDFGSDTLAELIALLGQLCLHIGVSWAVLQTLLRNETAWLFGCIFFAGMAFGTEVFIVNTTGEPAPLLILWWSIIGLISLAGFRYISPPADFRWTPPNQP
ncbi:MAG: hypothetical protein GYB66_15645 [Chloroflexi bacterium]|nr:hypothetical protein [Chloroflexota bacterium]